MLSLIPLIPMLPLAGFIAIGLFGRRLSRRSVGAIACGSVLLAFVLSAGAVVELAIARSGEAPAGPEAPVDHTDPGNTHAHESAVPPSFEVSLGHWLPPVPLVGSGLGDKDGLLRVDYGFQLDPLSGVMILVVTGVGFLIHVYSLAYMAGEEGFARFFAYLNLFMAMMLVLVLANNLVLMFVGWEGVGLCSYLLIGFFTDREFDARTGMTCADAGRKAFLVNRIGDLAFVIGILFVIFQFHTVDFSEIAEAIHAHSAELYGWPLLTLAALLLFAGACGKSAQIPLYVWLPDAMAGPTPVSALIHAATMVTAGVYMLARTSAIYWHAPDAMLVVAVVGAATALFAATLGLAQTDIKKVLAYSTVSQLGLMVLGAGVGAFVASIFHLVTHAFFKACLFLGAGSVIHTMAGEQDVRRMGGLKAWMPVTYATFLVSTLAIAGVPPLSGFFSKDAILAAAYAAPRAPILLWGLGLATALCTAFYMFRLLYLTFGGRFRGTLDQEDHLHESPQTMTWPLAVLAAGAFLVGLAGIPSFMTFGANLDGFASWLRPTVAFRGSAPDPSGMAIHLPVSVEWMLTAVAVSAALTGLALAWFVYAQGKGLLALVPERVRPFSRLLIQKYYVDELYDVVVLRPFGVASRAFGWFDRWIVDGAVNGVRHATVGLSHVSYANDRWVVDLAVNGIGAMVRGSSFIMRRVQTGVVQNYAAAMVLGSFVLLGVYLVLR